MRVLVVGGGGREHALAWRLRKSPRVDALFCAPGNAGIAEVAECVPIAADDVDGLERFARERAIDLTVVGPELPLVRGLVDRFRDAGLRAFGPTAAAARLEGSKVFTKELLARLGVPSARFGAFDDPDAAVRFVRELGAPLVVKADGLAAGKGVFVCHTQAELDAALPTVAGLGETFVVEELLEGDEVSVFALCDGVNAFALPAAQDFKRAYDRDEGPNTGGMGSYSPVAGIEAEELVAAVHRPVLAELERRGSPFVGALFAGLMLTDDGPRVLEFNCRFGDPETQSLMPRIEGDLLAALAAAAEGDVRGVELAEADDAAVTIVMTGGDYPAHNDSGSVIEGIDEAEAAGALVFHAGTALRGDRVVTNGGRILNVTATGETLRAARENAYAAAARITFADARYRHDIAEEAAAVV
jgi:phosphoribosylamine---glycine ligase